MQVPLMSDSSSSVELKDVVMGLHWAPPLEGRAPDSEPANLDAVCLLLDCRQRLLEVVHPGHLKNANGSVVHTGDSRTGASTWDDERVFVFLHALAEAVHSVVFAVVSSNARPFSDIDGATCHVSDCTMDDELLKVPLTALGPLTEYCVATLQRTPGGWVLRPAGPPGFSVSAVL